MSVGLLKKDAVCTWSLECTAKNGTFARTNA